MISRRQGQSDFLNKLVDDSSIGMKKTASDATTVAAEENTKTNHPASKTASMTLYQVRIARRTGQFIKVAGKKDLYQEIETNDFWKLSDDKKTVNRLFKEKDGLIVK